MTAVTRLMVLTLVCACTAQYAEERAPRYIAGASEQKQTSTPVPILKQINKHNDDGSYTYGYEAADGSFKIETKAPNGEVKGKYGYKDDTGKVRVVEYGANKFGFQPSGEGITVAPPTLVDETRQEEQRGQKQQGGRSQYRQPAQQQVDYDYDEPAPAPAPRPRTQPQSQYRPAPQQQPQYRPAPQQQQQPQYRPQQPQQQYGSQGPAPPKPAFFSGAAPAPESNLFQAAPARPQSRPKQDFRPAPSFQSFQPKPQIEYSQDFAPAQQYQPQQFQPQQRSQPFSMLDQLLKEFELPQSGASPLHDITFGSY